MSFCILFIMQYFIKSSISHAMFCYPLRLQYCASYWVVVLIRCLVRLLGTLYTSPSQVAEKVSFLCCLAAYNSSACCRGLASLVGGLCLPRVCSFFVRHAVDMFFSAITGCWGKSRAFPLHQFSQWLGFAVEVLYLFTVIHRK